MMATTLRQFLQCLCRDSPWNYAVSWKLNYWRQMILTLEDGYFDIPKSGRPMGDIVTESCPSVNQDMPSNVATSMCNWILGECPMELAVTEIPQTHHVVGKGVIGEVAYSGKPQWIFSENTVATELGSNLFNKFSGERMVQFVGDIKTILLVPLLPHGVLQLGSLKVVARDVKLVADIKEKFDEYQTLSVNFSLSRSCRESLVQSSQLMAHVVGDLEDPSVVTTHKMNEDLNIVDTINVEEAKAFSYANNFSHELSNEMMEFYFPGLPMEPEPLKKDYSDVRNDVNDSLSFECELQNALRPFLLEHPNQHILGLPGSQEHAKSRSINQFDLLDDIHLTSMESGGGLVKEAYGGNPLEAVIGNTCSMLNDISSDKHSGAWSFKTTSGHNVSFGRQEHSHSFEVDTVSQSCVTSAFVSKEAASTDVSHENLLECMLSAFIENDQPQKNSLHQRKGSTLPTTSKKRARGADNMRPRPRDRQLIQDRLKELRELIPNGQKCSIDGLLDKTVKHMRFLKNVTDQADKLKQEVLHKATNRKNAYSPETNVGDQNGTSWAIELGGDEQLCPILVKDLKLPGQILIEMICNDHGRFLEIANEIHRLELTILKGVMEPRSDTMWAYFIVETQAASGSFHRLDIFWPLMQLLQQNQTTISSKI